MNETPSINDLIWEVFSYVTPALFFFVPFIRMVYRPSGFAR